MSNPVLPRRSFTANAVPIASTDIRAAGEMLINWTDGVIYTKDSAGNLISWSLGAAGGAGPAGSFGDPQTIQEKSANYTLQLSDVGTLLLFTSSGNQTLTIPAEASVAWVAGSHIDIARVGSGGVLVSAPSIYAAGAASLRTTYSGASLVYLGSDTWLMVGDLT